VPPELKTDKSKPTDKVEKQEMPDDSIHNNMKRNSDQNAGGNNYNESWEDETASNLAKEADAADETYKKSKSEKDKQTCVELQMKAANYFMFDADLPPKDKYRPALQRYRRVLELDPGNKEAIANKTQIEDIYKSMGKPIPN